MVPLVTKQARPPVRAGHVFFVAILWGCVTVCLYTYFLEIPSSLSFIRLLIAAGLGAFPAAAAWFRPVVPPADRQAFARRAARVLYISISLCIFLWIFNLPEFTLFAPYTRLKLSVNAPAAAGGTLKIAWINNGLSDVPLSGVKWSPGSSIGADSALLKLDAGGQASLEWQGRAWKQIRVVVSAPPEMTLTLESSTAGSQVVQVQSSSSAQKVVPIPVFGPWYYLLLEVLLLLVTLFSAAGLVALVLGLPLARLGGWLEARIPLLLPPRLTAGLATGSSILILAFVSLTGFNNRLYADDYCYAVTLRAYGFWGAVLYNFQTLNGRLMSHVVDFLALAAGQWSVFLGPVFVLVGVGGSLAYFLAALIEIEGRKKRCALAGLISLAILASTLMAAPNLYESVFWSLHALILTGGLGALNLVLGLLARRTNGRRRVETALVLLVLGFLGAFFNEAISILMLALFGMILAGLVLRWKAFRQEGLPWLPVLAFLLGASAALAFLVFSPGGSHRLSALGVSADLSGKFSGYLMLVRNNLAGLFLENHAAGLWILACVWIFGYGSGRLVPQNLKFSSVRLKDAEKFLLCLALFLLPLAVYLPSAFVNGYFPRRTEFIPLYAIFLIHWLLAMYLGNLTKASPLGIRSLSLLTAVAALLFGGLSMLHLSGVSAQMQRFAVQWDARAALIQQTRAAGQTQISVQPYRDGFGTDLSNTKDAWLFPCVNEYYGLQFSVDDSH